MLRHKRDVLDLDTVSLSRLLLLKLLLLPIEQRLLLAVMWRLKELLVVHHLWWR